MTPPAVSASAGSASRSSVQRTGQRSRTEPVGGGGSTSDPNASQTFSAQYVQHNTQQNLLQHHQSVHNTIDPKQLEDLVGSLVQARVEAIALQMKGQMEKGMKQLELDYAKRLSQVQLEGETRVQQVQAEGQLALANMVQTAETECAQMRQESQSQIQQASLAILEERQKMQKLAETQQQQAKETVERETAKVVKQAESHVANAETRALEQITALQKINRELLNERDRLQHAATLAEERAEKLRIEMQQTQQVAVAAVPALNQVVSLSGSPAGNPFAASPPQLPSCHTEVLSNAGSFASASAQPFEVMFCPCCGIQNVMGRPAVNNGAGISVVRDVPTELAPMPAPCSSIKCYVFPDAHA